jgi:murein L,D-transpeptidase YafK
MAGNRRTLFFVVIAAFLVSSVAAQTSFVDYQKSSLKVADAFNRKEDTLRKLFVEKGIAWPAKYLYIRSFKYDAQLEVWAKNEAKDPYKLVKQYKVCMQSGTTGPKRLQGDFQVPEGVYHINEFNPNSLYHLSLGLNYPNASDKILSDSLRPGGEIYIHGSCVSVGCIPVNDDEIEELYIITSYAQANGLDFIPVHIFPVRYNVKRSAEYLANSTKNNEPLRKFENRLKDIFEYFNDKKQLPLVLVNKKGEYVVN